MNLFVHILHPVHPRAVRTVHIEKRWVRSPWARIPFDEILFPLFFRRETAVSRAVEHQLDSRLLARLLKRKAVLAYNGIDERLFSILYRRKEDYFIQTPTGQRLPLPSGLPAERPLLGVIGRLSQQKGHAVLIEAMQEVVRQRQAHLIVIGTGELEGVIRSQVQELGLENCIHFLGSRKDVLDILPHLDLLVSSSLWEGFPTVLLEGMALGVPVVATDVSGSRELVVEGETGMLAPPGSHTLLAEAILVMLDHREAARRMAETAMQRAAGFTIQAAAKTIGTAYLDAG
jgi:glycosyltransferase involved in cell wall biosynthesis